MTKAFTWLDRGSLNSLLTEQLRQISGCEGATISVGPSRDAAPGESNWFNFWTTAPTNANGPFIRAVAGGVVSEARERYNVLDS
jgi:hypothetical protein